MPKHQLTEPQKRIIRAFSQALRQEPDKTEWSYKTIPSDDRFDDLGVCITCGIPAVENIQDIHKSDLKRFEQIGLIIPISGKKAFRVNTRMILRFAR